MRIAIIGLPAIYGFGLRSIIQTRWPSHSVELFQPHEQGWQTADMHIVSASALAMLARFLMPRLDKVLLVTTSAQRDVMMPMLSPLADYDTVCHKVEALMNRCEAQESSPHQGALLTQREIEVIKLIACGATSRQIAERLCISTNTVLTHRKNIATKTGLHTVSAITHYAMVHGLLH